MPLQDANPTPSFGGLGLRAPTIGGWAGNTIEVSMTGREAVSHPGIASPLKRNRPYWPQPDSSQN